MIVPTHRDLLWAWHGVKRPTLANGTAQALPMTADAMNAVPAKIPFGFTAPTKKRRRAKKAAS